MRSTKSKSAKEKVLKKFHQAYCVKLADGTGYIVWPGKIQPRGFERPAIGLGRTARAAWQCAQHAI